MERKTKIKYMPHLKQFKITFDNDTDKPLLTMQVYVNNSKAFNALDKEGKLSALQAIDDFQRVLDTFKSELNKELNP